MLNTEINNLKKDLVMFATFVEDMISKSIKGLLNNQPDILHEVINEDEPKANEYELEVEEKCTALIAQFQPLAKDLRTVLMIYKMNNDLERLGDQAVNISESGLFLINKPPISIANDDILKIKSEALRMLHDSITSFIEEDTELSKTVCDRDSIVDDLRDSILLKLTEYMKTDRSSIERCVSLIRIARNLERVADLSTNICEDVMYIVSGTVIKHRKDKEED
ncbi:phosphate signaling complex protein PhoU [candidate division KSB1 bacterium]